MKICKNYLMLFCLVLLSTALSGCITVHLVQPYDADLYSNTEAFYKKASATIAKGINVSPKLPKDVKAIPEESKEQHPGHYNQFKNDYDILIVDSNSLILRSLSNSGQIDEIGRNIQTKIEEAIVSTFPASCDSLHETFSSVSLTTRNYIDLKCLIGRWSIDHQGNGAEDITYGKQVLKKANWEARDKTLFESILAIQKAEASKKEE